MQPENVVSTPSTQVQPTPLIQYSSRVARYSASVVDGFVIALINIFSLVFLVNKDTSVFFVLITVLFRFIVPFFYFWVLTALYGQTLGKRLFGLRVVTENGIKLGWGKSFLREFVGKLGVALTLGIGYIVILFDKRRQGLHDKLAATIVVQEKELVGVRKLFAYFLFVLGILLPIVAVIGIILSAVLVSVNPASQIQKAQEAKQKQDQLIQQQEQLLQQQELKAIPTSIPSL